MAAIIFECNSMISDIHDNMTWTTPGGHLRSMPSDPKRTSLHICTPLRSCSWVKGTQSMLSQPQVFKQQIATLRWLRVINIEHSRSRRLIAHAADTLWTKLHWVGQRAEIIVPCRTRVSCRISWFGEHLVSDAHSYVHIYRGTHLLYVCMYMYSYPYM